MNFAGNFQIVSERSRFSRINLESSINNDRNIIQNSLTLGLRAMSGLH